MPAPSNARDQYEHWAAIYDRLGIGWAAPAELVAAVRRHMPEAAWHSVVDLGVGTGQASLPWREIGARVVGVDVSSAMLARAAEDRRFHALVERDLDDGLPESAVRHDDADLVVSCGGLHLVRDLPATLTAARAVLVCGGLLAFTYVPELAATRASADTESHGHAHATADVLRWVQDAGFTVLEQREFDAFVRDGVTVRHALVVARDARPSTPWPESLRWIDRTACVDRARLRAMVDRPPFVPTTVVDAPALRDQIATGTSDPRVLVWPAAGAPSARHDAGCHALAILPHPDDESIYAGGTIAAWARAGSRVELVVATAGAGGRGGPDLATRRADELVAAAAILGVRALACLAWDDGGKYHDAARTRPLLADDAIAHWGLLQAVGDVVREIRARRPQVVLSLDPEVDPNLSLHAHHLALGRIVTIAFHLAADPAYAPELGAPWAAHEHRVMAPCVGHAERHAVDAAIKHAAVAAHRSQGFSTTRLLAALARDRESVGDTWEWCRTVQRRQAVALPLVRVRRRASPPSQQRWRDAQAEALAHHRPRTALVEILCRQAYTRASDGAVWRSLDLLGQPDTVAVVTGQQVGLLGGPALTLSKALSAVAWANLLCERGIQAVPLFWMATQDHDLDEVRTVARLGQAPLVLDLPRDGASVGRRRIGDGITTLMLRWLAAMPRPPSLQLHAALLEGHTEDASFAHAFARMLAHATRGTGLVILDPDDRAFAALGRGVIARELLGPRRADAALADARARLAATGHAEVVPTGRDLLQLFWCDEQNVRRRLRACGDQFLAGTRALDRTDLLACLELTPERFTPAALLRPVIQDAIIPTIAYVAGPTEARYLAQTHELHAWAGVPTPLVVPRGSLRIMGSADLEAVAVAGGPATLDAAVAPETALGIAMLDPSERRLHDRVAQLAQMLVRMPGTRDQASATWRDIVALASRGDAAWADATTHIEAALAHTGPGTRAYVRAHRATTKLRAAMLRRARRRDPERIAAWRRIAETPIPGERRMSMAEALLRGGDGLPASLATGLAHDPSAQVIVQVPRTAPRVDIVAPSQSLDRARYGVLALGGLGGSGRVAWDVARGLGERGHAIVMLAGGDPHWAAEFGSSLHHVTVPAPHAPIAADDGWVAPLAEAIVQVALDHRLESLSVHYGVGLAEAAVAARGRLSQLGQRLRVCVTLHGSDVTVFGTQPAQRERLRAAIESADEVTAVSQWLATQAQEILALRRRPQVVTNAVDTALFFPEPRPQRVPGERATLCHASNFRTIKRPLDTIDVLARVLADDHDVELSMIGDGPLRADAEAHARALGVAGRTRFVGPVAPPALAGRLRTSDIVLVTSASESFSLVALEAMASGAVLVGTRCGGLEELLGTVPDWIDRLLAEPGDIGGLAARVGALLADPDRFAEARAAGLAVCRSGYAQHQQLTAYAALLRGSA